MRVPIHQSLDSALVVEFEHICCFRAIDSKHGSLQWCGGAVSCLGMTPGLLPVQLSYLCNLFCGR